MSAPAPTPEALVDAIRRLTPALLPGHPRVARIDPVERWGGPHPGVWRVTAEDGSRTVVKHQFYASLTRGKPYDLLKVEETVCRLLHGASCPVPRLYATEPSCDLVFSEWCGDLTLDDVCQDDIWQENVCQDDIWQENVCQDDAWQGDVCQDDAWQDATAEHLPFYAFAVVDGFTAIQAALHNHTATLSALAFPGCDEYGLLEAWQRVTRKIDLGLPLLATRLGARLDSRTEGRSRTLWSETARTLGHAPSLLGPTDYNARNVVVDRGPHGLRFIEFSKLGWDWPERRLVQYATALGAGRPNGNIRCLLDRAAARAYAERAGDYRSDSIDRIARWLDGHHLSLHLLAGCRFVEALHAPGTGDASTGWANPEARLRQVRDALATPLSDDPAIGELRSLLTP